MTVETKSKLSKTSGGLIVKILDSSNNLRNSFSSIKETAKFFQVSVGFIRRCIDYNKNYNGFTFISEIKNKQIGVFDVNYKLIEVLDNGIKVSKIYNIPKTIVYLRCFDILYLNRKLIWYTDPSLISKTLSLGECVLSASLGDLMDNFIK